MRIQTTLREAQNGQVFANLARAFHLPPEKVEPAVDIMVIELTDCLQDTLQSRRSLADLVELLGQGGHEQVLDTPHLVGAPHTQVIGNEVLSTVVGRDESKKMALHAANAAGISEMIAEYLLPAVATLLIGALVKLCRPALDKIMGHEPLDGADDPDPAVPEAPELPRVSGGVGFSGSTGGNISMATPGSEPSRYIELADDIRRTDRVPGEPDAAQDVRRALAPILGFPVLAYDWARRIRKWSTAAFNTVLGGFRR